MSCRLSLDTSLFPKTIVPFCSERFAFSYGRIMVEATDFSTWGCNSTLHAPVFRQYTNSTNSE